METVAISKVTSDHCQKACDAAVITSGDEPVGVLLPLGHLSAEERGQVRRLARTNTFAAVIRALQGSESAGSLPPPYRKEEAR